MDAKDLLRRYLEQRRELGESELVLDGLHVEDVMRLLGAAGKSGGPSQAPRSIRETAPAGTQDWRASLRDAGVNVDPPMDSPPVSRRMAFPDVASEASPPTVEIPHETVFKKGIVVAANDAELIPGAIEKLLSLDEIAAKVSACTRCDLYKTATKAVPAKAIRTRSWYASAKHQARRKTKQAARSSDRPASF